MPRQHQSTHHRLVTILGERKTATLESALGAHTIRIPLQAQGKRERRDRRIAEALRHKSYRVVARRFRLDLATVVRIAKRNGAL